MKSDQRWHVNLSLLGNLCADIEHVVSQAMKFICACYGMDDVTSITAARVKA